MELHFIKVPVPMVMMVASFPGKWQLFHKPPAAAKPQGRISRWTRTHYHRLLLAIFFHSCKCSLLRCTFSKCISAITLMRGSRAQIANDRRWANLFVFCFFFLFLHDQNPLKSHQLQTSDASNDAPRGALTIRAFPARTAEFRFSKSQS